MTEDALPTRGHLVCPILEYVLTICITSSAQSSLSLCAYLTPLSYYHPLSHIVQHSLPKSRLPPAHEPPTQEAHEAPHDSDDSHGDPCYGTSTEAALVDASAGVVASAVAHHEAHERTGG
eukprot:XP_001703859.1 Hypothetical protein GL50803_30848 [Giardia lamblia ATCC 50803]